MLSRRPQLVVDPPANITLDLVDRATRVDNRGRGQLACGRYECVVEVDPHLDSGTISVGFAAGEP